MDTMDEKKNLVSQRELLRVMADQSELNIKMLDALHNAAAFAASAGQSSTQYFILLVKMVEEDDDVDLNQLMENQREMVETTKKMLLVNQEIADLIGARQKEMKRRVEEINASLEKFR